jgi:hypothetical protein
MMAQDFSNAERIVPCDRLAGLENAIGSELGTSWLMLDPCDQTLDLEFRAPSETGTPIDVWNGVVLRWRVDPLVDFEALTQAINHGVIDELLDALAAGHSVEWDGSNHRGTLDASGRRASAALQAWLDDEAPRLQGESAGLWSAYEWLEPLAQDITERLASGATVDDLVNEYEDEGRGLDVVLYDTERYIRELAEVED